jgi:hypothetical protein
LAAGGKLVASVIRLNSGGSTTIKKIGLNLEQAKELAARLREAGEPAGCAWCVRLDEEEEEAYVPVKLMGLEELCI